MLENVCSAKRLSLFLQFDGGPHYYYFNFFSCFQLFGWFQLYLQTESEAYGMCQC